MHWSVLNVRGVLISCGQRRFREVKGEADGRGGPSMAGREEEGVGLLSVPGSKGIRWTQLNRLWYRFGVEVGCRIGSAGVR